MDPDEKARLAEALRASRTFDMETVTVRGPLDLLALRAELTNRLESSGGRPTDPTWTMARQVPFKEESWAQLQGLATDVGASGRRVGPGQVAALLIEKGLQELEEKEWAETLERSRRMPLLSQPRAAEAAAVSYNQLDDWVQRGWILPAKRTGRQRSFGADEIIRARWLRSVLPADGDGEPIVRQIRASDLSARYLLVANQEVPMTARTRTDLYRLLEHPGGYFVIDQLPERRRLLGEPRFPDETNEEEAIRPAL